MKHIIDRLIQSIYHFWFEITFKCTMNIYFTFALNYMFPLTYPNPTKTNQQKKSTHSAKLLVFLYTQILNIWIHTSNIDFGNLFDSNCEPLEFLI